MTPLSTIRAALAAAKGHEGGAMRLRDRRRQSEETTRYRKDERRHDRQYRDGRVAMWSILNEQTHSETALDVFEAMRASRMRANAVVMGGEWS